MDRIPEDAAGRNYIIEHTVSSRESGIEHEILRDELGKSRAITNGETDRVLCDCDGSIDRVERCETRANKRSKKKELYPDLVELRKACSKLGLSHLNKLSNEV